MSLAEFLAVGAGIADLAGSVILVGFVLLALLGFVRGRGVAATRLALADGAVLALSIKTAGALLKTIELRTWDQLAVFSVILTLRVLLKRLFAWEGVRLRRGKAETMAERGRSLDKSLE